MILTQKLSRLVVFLTLLVGSTAWATPGAVNVRDYGAVGDGITDDRAAIQAALDAGAGHEVYFPIGTYLMTFHPGNFWCVQVHPGTSLRGEDRAGTMVVEAPNTPESVQLFQVENAPEVTFSTMTLDGASSMQSAQPQRHGIFVKNSPYFTARHVTAQHFTGDGFYVYSGSNDAVLYDVASLSNDRNGYTLGGSTEWTTIIRSQFLHSAAEQGDSEGGPQANGINHVTIVGNTFDGQGRSDDFPITMTGSSADGLQRSHNWTVTDNNVNGSALAVWIDDLTYSRNVHANATSKPAMYVFRSDNRIDVERNTFADTGPAAFDAGGIVYVVGTNQGQSPGDVVIARNTMSTAQAAFGVTAVCARSVLVEGNTIAGAGTSAYNAGVFVRTTRVEEPVQSAIVRDNVIGGFGGLGVMLGGNGAAVIESVSITGNTFTGANAGLSLDDGWHEALDVTLGGNTGTWVTAAAPGAVTAMNATRWVVAP